MVFGPTALTWYHHPSPVQLKPKDPKDDSAPQSIVSVSKSAVPPFYPNPFFPGGHLQTCAVLLGAPDIPIHYKRALLTAESPDGTDTGTFSIDVVVPPPTETAEDTPSKKILLESDPEYFPPRTSFFTDDDFEAWSSDTETNTVVVMLHGLSGGSHETYVRMALEPLVRPKKDGGLGFDALVVNARGCAWTKLTSTQMFNAMWTADIRQVIKVIHKKFPNRPIMTVGFSLGANILANYLGEESSSCPVHAAVLISSPHDIDACAKIMFTRFTGRQYSKHMASSLKSLFERNFAMLSQHPKVDVDEVRKATYLADYDHEFTAKVFGFRTYGEYYRASSSVDKLLEVKVPTLIINAEDDPISVQEGFPRKEAEANPYLSFVTTGTGGHIGWFGWFGERWFPKPITAFLEKMAVLEVVKGSESK